VQIQQRLISNTSQGASLVPRTKRVPQEKGNHAKHPKHFPSQKLLDKLLIIWNPDNFPQQKIEIIKRFCKKKQLKWQEIKTNEVTVAAKQIRRRTDDFEYLLIVGDEKQFPTYKFTHVGIIAHTDYIYQGDSHLKIGRVVGGTRVITEHLKCCCGDSNLTIVIDTEPTRSEDAIKQLEKMGYQVFHWRGINGQSFKLMEPLIEKAQMIFQYSDGTARDKVRGNAKEWYGGTPARAFFTYKDLRRIQFINYPLIFSEACTTANFGPFVRAMCEANATYIGASCTTYNGEEPDVSWENDHSCDGIKFGILDQLDKHHTAGDMFSHVIKVLRETLSSSSQKCLMDIQKGKPMEIKDTKIISVIEWVLFGNPLRILNKSAKTRSRQKKR